MPITVAVKIGLMVASFGISVASTIIARKEMNATIVSEVAKAVAEAKDPT